MYGKSGVPFFTVQEVMDEYRKLQRERQELLRDREEFTKQCTEERRQLARELADIQTAKEVE